MAGFETGILKDGWLFKLPFCSDSVVQGLRASPMMIPLRQNTGIDKDKSEPVHAIRILTIRSCHNAKLLDWVESVDRFLILIGRHTPDDTAWGP
jgi:hypothetical protein